MKATSCVQIPQAFPRDFKYYYSLETGYCHLLKIRQTTLLERWKPHVHLVNWVLIPLVPIVYFAICSRLPTNFKNWDGNLLRTCYFWNENIFPPAMGQKEWNNHFSHIGLALWAPFLLETNESRCENRKTWCGRSELDHGKRAEEGNEIFYNIKVLVWLHWYKKETLIGMFSFYSVPFNSLIICLKNRGAFSKWN